MFTFANVESYFINADGWVTTYDASGAYLFSLSPDERDELTDELDHALPIVRA